MLLHIAKVTKIMNRKVVFPGSRFFYS